ncbi:MAG TPA: MBL fold metallo-hydrolase [Arachnia sp.]|nr:MBL fold metallo-hydrolase [Arachnia sp.]HMT85735.1 MBL fold metallo-hydrolase [Arachnia sp.]
MLVSRIVVSPWQANAYLVSGSAEGGECVVVDPGILGAGSIAAELDRLSLTPVALLATHGHLDHIGDAHILAAEYGVPPHGIPLYCAVEDHPMLTTPSLGLGLQMMPLIHQFLGRDALPPVADLRPYEGSFELAGLTITPSLAPGHTPGCTLLEVSDGTETLLFTGDVLFKGSIGRTDLPGGSMSEMRRSLAALVERFDPSLTVLPGHGQATTIEAEIASNPYL